MNINSSDPAAQFVQKSQQLNVTITGIAPQGGHHESAAAVLGVYIPARSGLLAQVAGTTHKGRCGEVIRAEAPGANLGAADIPLDV